MTVDIKIKNSDKYVFHRSSVELVVLEPRQAKNFNKATQSMEFHGKPAVVATDDFEIAAFRALTVILDGRSAFGVSNGKKYLKLAINIKNDYLDKIGYVYVLEKENFSQFGSFEWRSYKRELPVEIIKVTANDINGNIIEII